MPKRVEIPNYLAAQVMFASDKTCCVCRDSLRKTQIHHINGDPSNNDFKNLAVVCLDCHSNVHTQHAFARNLSPDLIRLYNESWREIVKTRLLPRGSSSTVIEYTQEVLLEINLIPYDWKNYYISCHPAGWSHRGDQQFTDVWEMMAEDPHEYSQEEWERYRPLFDSVVNSIIEHLERVLMVHSDAVSVEMKISILRATRDLEGSRIGYLSLPQTLASVKDRNTIFAAQFKHIIQTLSHLAYFADQTRKAMASVA